MVTSAQFMHLHNNTIEGVANGSSKTLGLAKF